MANRILKDTVCESRGLTSCSFYAQDLYKRLITYADDYGRFNADPQIMIARLYPRELDVVGVDDLIDGLIELAGIGKICFYTSQSRHDVYGTFPRWSEHQRMRDSKKKMPDPDDTRVNDWYLSRFVPMAVKVSVIERDAFKCRLCGKRVSEVSDAKRLVKMGTGTFHIDFAVPCDQGGQAISDNLQLTCSKCNLSQKRPFIFEEILTFAENGGDVQKFAASCGELRPESNPIQSESETESESKSRKRQHLAALNETFELFWKAYPKKASKEAARKSFIKLDPDAVLFERMLQAIDAAKVSEQWTKENGQFIPYPATWLNGRRWEDELKPVTVQVKNPFKEMLEGLNND